MSPSSTLSPSPAVGRFAPRSIDQDGLQRHMHQCAQANGTWHSLRCKAEAIDGFLSGRFVSTLVVAIGLLALSVYW